MRRATGSSTAARIQLLSSTVAELALLAVERGAAGGSLKAFEVYVDVVVAALLQDG
ncbi:MAG: hypothetical protein KJS97_07990 [Alphaproteobacteria bacterium]|nr:hypothetical protein [Alphaproteobacteria bacterium]